MVFGFFPGDIKKSENERPIFETDFISTFSGDIKTTFLGHGSLLFEWNNKFIYIDPISRVADYFTLPKANIILITHEHSDHFDLEVIKKLLTHKTDLIFTNKCRETNLDGLVMRNGEELFLQEIRIEAVPAYNILHKRESGQPIHPKGIGNGYILTFSDIKIYVAGDTEIIPEMKNLKMIDIAFLPMNLPYTMTPEMVVNAVKMFKPKILYPYHYGDTDISYFLEIMKSINYVEVRIRKMS